MSIVCTRTIAAALGAVGLISTAAASLAQQSNDPKAPDAQRGDAARDGKKTVDEFAEAAKHLEGPAANPECVWLGRRGVSPLLPDDLDPAFPHPDLYYPFRRPAAPT